MSPIPMLFYFMEAMKDMQIDQQEKIMEQAADKARETMNKGYGGPFGAAIVKDGKIIAVASNSVLKDHDPTAHAEVNAIRAAGKVLGTHDLSGCELYATGYPCPMCLSAILWANIKTVYFACTPEEADAVGFRDDFMYRYLEKGPEGRGELLTLKQTGHDTCIRLFQEYAQKSKVLY